MWKWLFRTKPDAGLAEASAAAARADRDLAHVLERGQLIAAHTEDMCRLRRENNFAARIEQAYAAKRGGW